MPRSWLAFAATTLLLAHGSQAITVEVYLSCGVFRSSTTRTGAIDAVSTLGSGTVVLEPTTTRDIAASGTVGLSSSGVGSGTLGGVGTAATVSSNSTALAPSSDPATLSMSFGASYPASSSNVATKNSLSTASQDHTIPGGSFSSIESPTSAASPTLLSSDYTYSSGIPTTENTTLPATASSIGATLAPSEYAPTSSYVPKTEKIPTDTTSSFYQETIGSDTEFASSTRATNETTTSGLSNSYVPKPEEIPTDTSSSSHRETIGSDTQFVSSTSVAATSSFTYVGEMSTSPALSLSTASSASSFSDGSGTSIAGSSSGSSTVSGLSSSTTSLPVEATSSSTALSSIELSISSFATTTGTSVDLTQPSNSSTVASVSSGSSFTSILASSLSYSPSLGSFSSTAPSSSSTISQPCGTAAPADERLHCAFRRGDPNIVTESELLEAIPDVLNNRTSLAYQLIPDEPMTWLLNTNTGYVRDPGPLEPILKGNRNFKPGDFPTDQLLAVAGTGHNSETRLAYFGGNPFITDDGGVYYAWKPVSDPGMVAFDQRMVEWMLNRLDDASNRRRQTGTFNIVMSGIKDSAELYTLTALQQLFPSATINNGSPDRDVCDFIAEQTNPCLQYADLLITGDNRSTGDDDVAAQIVAAYRSGIPLIVMTENGNPTPDSQKVANLLGISIGQNYFHGQTVIDAAEKSYLAPSKVIIDDTREKSLLIQQYLSVDPLVAEDYAVCIFTDGHEVGSIRMYECVEDPPAGVLDHALPYFSALLWLQTATNGLNTAGTDVFNGKDGDSSDIMRLFALLSDKIRRGPGQIEGDSASAIVFPVDTRTDGVGVTRLLFADWMNYITSKATGRAVDLGTLWCHDNELVASNSCPDVQFTAAGDFDRSFETLVSLDQWTGTGITQEPGRPITVTLLSEVDMPVYIRFFGISNADCWSGCYSEAGISLYNRPQFARSSWIPLTTGVPITMNHAYGGPLYLRFDASKTNDSSGIQVRFQNATRHAILQKISDDAALQEFGSDLATSPAYWADIVGTGFEIHTPINKLRQVTSDNGYEEENRILYYNGSQGMTTLLTDFRDSWAGFSYQMAGLRVEGTPMTELLSQTNQDICEAFGWPCLDPVLNSRVGVQHVTYDAWAACGDYCSGNPILASGNPIPLSFSIIHEIGHNLQIDPLSIGWVDTGSGANMDAINAWPNYERRSQEVSNQIFPYFGQWTYWRLTLPQRNGKYFDNSPLTRYYANEMLIAFAARQSAYYGLRKDGQQVVVDYNCNIMQSFPTGTRPDVMLQDAGWSSDVYNADDAFRITFYLKVPQLVEGKTMSTGHVLEDGRDIYTLLYQAGRLFLSASEDAASWQEQQSLLGLDLYNYTDPMYGSEVTVQDFLENDFQLILLCKITGYDFRPYFAAHGVFYTSKANQQVEANARSSPLQYLGQPHLIMGTLQPPVNLSVVALGADGAYVTNTPFFDVIDPSVTWPGSDNDYDGVAENLVDWHPRLCPGLVKGS